MPGIPSRRRCLGFLRSRRIGVAAAAFLVSASASSAARADDMLAIPVLRLALGPAVHVAPEPDVGLRLGLDVTAGFVGMFGDVLSSFVISPEIGYTFDSFGLHAFNATCGVGFGGPVVSLLYQPRLILGTAGDDFAVGMRNGIAVRGVADILGLEVGHQFFNAESVLHHDIRILFSLNVGAFGYVIHELGNLR